MTSVKVRIAVAVDADGNWFACNGNQLADENAMGNALDGVSGVPVVAAYWVTAELPIPEPSRFSEDGLVRPYSENADLPVEVEGSVMP